MVGHSSPLVSSTNCHLQHPPGTESGEGWGAVPDGGTDTWDAITRLLARLIAGLERFIEISSLSISVALLQSKRKNNDTSLHYYWTQYYFGTSYKCKTQGCNIRHWILNILQIWILNIWFSNTRYWILKTQGCNTRHWILNMRSAEQWIMCKIDQNYWIPKCYPMYKNIRRIKY